MKVVVGSAIDCTHLNSKVHTTILPVHLTHQIEGNAPVIARLYLAYYSTSWLSSSPLQALLEETYCRSPNALTTVFSAKSKRPRLEQFILVVLHLALLLALGSNNRIGCEGTLSSSPRVMSTNNFTREIICCRAHKSKPSLRCPLELRAV